MLLGALLAVCLTGEVFFVVEARSTVVTESGASPPSDVDRIRWMCGFSR